MRTPKRRDQFRRGRRAGEDQQRHRQEGDAGEQRVVAFHFLQVEGDEVPHAEHPGEEQRDDQVGGPQRRHLEDVERDQRVARQLALDQGEEAEQDDAERQRDQHAERAPAERVGADDAVDDRGQPAADQHRAGDVELALVGGGALAAGSRRRPASTTAIPTGMLMMKTAGQLKRLGEGAAEQDAGRCRRCRPSPPRGRGRGCVRRPL